MSTWDAAGIGAAIGSVVPGVGTVTGGTIGGLVGSISSLFTSSKGPVGPTEDERVRMFAGVNASIYDLAEMARTGTYFGSPPNDWGSLKARTTPSRSYMRTTAMAVGAIDSGYKSRGDAGAAQANAAAKTWAAAVDRQLGTSLATHMNNEDIASFIRYVATISPPKQSQSTPAPGGGSPGISGSGSVQLGKGGAVSPAVLVAAGVVGLLLVLLLVRR